MQLRIPQSRNVLQNLLPVAILVVVFVVLVVVFLYSSGNRNIQFADQASSMLRGELHLTMSSQHDMVLVDDKQFWPLGPFPSVPLLLVNPIVGPIQSQAVTQAILVLILLVLLYRLARHKGYNQLDSLFLTAAFMTGSVFVGLWIDPRSWFFAQVVAVTLSIAVLYEWETRRRWWLIGIGVACILATRTLAVGLVLVLLAHMWRRHFERRGLLYLLIPVLIACGLLAWFDYARFGDPFFNGYAHQNIGPLEPYRDIGFFSIDHLPTNVYWYFLSSVTPVVDSTYPGHLTFPYFTYGDWGLSLFIISPFFLYGLRSLRHGLLEVKVAWMVIGLTLLVLLVYFGSGWSSFGPRYTADFLPLLYYVTLFAFAGQQLAAGHRVLIAGSAALNTYLLAGHLFL